MRNLIDDQDSASRISVMFLEAGKIIRLSDKMIRSLRPLKISQFFQIHHKITQIYDFTFGPLTRISLVNEADYSTGAGPAITYHHNLSQWFSKYFSQSISISITWELRDAYSQVSPPNPLNQKILSLGLINLSLIIQVVLMNHRIKCFLINYEQPVNL